MEAEGIRKVFKEQNAEGAIYYLYDELEKLKAKLEEKPAAEEAKPEVMPYTEGL